MKGLVIGSATLTPATAMPRTSGNRPDRSQHREGEAGAGSALSDGMKVVRWTFAD